MGSKNDDTLEAAKNNLFAALNKEHERRLSISKEETEEIKKKKRSLNSPEAGQPASERQKMKLV